MAKMQPAQITLKKEAAKRLDIQTAAVPEADETARRKDHAICRAALRHQGETWAFTNPEPQNYIREKSKLIGSMATKSFSPQGPAAGTKVVTVGVANCTAPKKSSKKNNDTSERRVYPRRFVLARLSRRDEPGELARTIRSTCRIQ